MRAWVTVRIGPLRVAVPVATCRRASPLNGHGAHRAPRPPVPVAHHVANGMVAGGVVGMLGLGFVAPPAAAVALLVAVAGIVAMMVQLPARMRRYRAIKK